MSSQRVQTLISRRRPGAQERHSDWEGPKQVAHWGSQAWHCSEGASKYWAARQLAKQEAGQLKKKSGSTQEAHSESEGPKQAVQPEKQASQLWEAAAGKKPSGHSATH